MDQKTVGELQGDKPEVNNMFVTTLQQFRDGESISELSEHLQALVAAVRDTGKKGSLTYTIKITPHNDAVALTDEIKLKAPEMPRDASIFFATDDNLLQRDNPNQKNLPFREVPREVPPVVKDLAQQAAAAQ